MSSQITLSEAVEAYLSHRAAKGIAPTTPTNEGFVLRRFVAWYGDVQMRTAVVTTSDAVRRALPGSSRLDSVTCRSVRWPSEDLPRVRDRTVVMRGGHHGQYGRVDADGEGGESPPRASFDPIHRAVEGDP